MDSKTPGRTFKQEILEQVDSQFLRVPFESLKREARSRKTVVEGIQQFCNAITKAADDASLSHEDAEAILVDAQAQLKGLIDQNDRAVESETADLQRCQARFQHLADIKEKANSCVDWNYLRLPRLIVDYLLREGHFQTAATLSEQSGCKPLCDWHIFGNAQAIMQSLRQRDCTAALQWCHANASRLKRSKSPLLFRLHVQQFVELIKRDDTMGALEYARTHLAAFADAHFAEAKRALALLVFRRHTRCDRYLPLLDDARWQDLADLFLQELLRIHSLLELPLLELQLQAGLIALKCPLSYEQGCTAEDPLHMPLMQRLAEHLPWAKHVQSKLVCALSKEPMADTNPPLVLPNGHVYGRQALEAMAAESGGHVTCPHTQETFLLKECVPAYIM